MHNALPCQDMVKQYERKNGAPSFLLKVDLCKAQDTLDWNFLKEMIVAMNFPRHFIKITMTCITSTSYALMINGTPSKLFKAKRGLR